MNFVKIVSTWITTLVLLLIAWGVIQIVPKCMRVTSPGGQQDLERIKSFNSYSVDGTVQISELEQEDIICFRLGEKEDQRAHFGYVVALPGQSVAIKNRQVLVDDEPFVNVQTSIRVSDRPPVLVPDRHVFIISDRQRNDSFRLGPIPVEAYRGRVGVWMR